MTTSDLRINNLILTPKEAGGKPFLRSIVQEIKSNSVIVDGDREVKIEDCAGIPLAAEWLEGFGFEKVITPPQSVEHFENKDCWVYVLNGFFEVEINTLHERHNLCRKYKYVHELQNIAHSLTGEELTVVSPASAQ